MDTARRAASPRKGTTFTEIVVAAGLLGACMVPVVSLVTSSLREGATSREDILARRVLADIIERYKDSPLAELERIPARSGPAYTDDGVDDEAVATDPVLASRIRRLLAGGRSAGTRTRSALAGYGALARGFSLARTVTFQKDRYTSGRHALEARVKIVHSGRTREYTTTKLIVR